MSYGEAAYWHNHPDLARLAQNMREQLAQQSMTAYGELVDVTTRR